MCGMKLYMSEYLAYCQEVLQRTLNCLNFLPVLASQDGRGFSSTSLTTHPYIVVQQVHTLSPNVVCFHVFSPSQTNPQYSQQLYNKAQVFFEFCMI